MIKREDFVGRLAERPFRPFRVHTSGGRVHEVRHPETALVTARSVVIAVPRAGAVVPQDIEDDYALVSILRITGIEPVAGAVPDPPAAGNGQSVAS